MIHSESLEKFAMALSALQKEMPTITFDSSVKVTTKTGGNYSFSYASLPNIVETTRPLLAKHGLSVTQLTEEDNAVTTLLMHNSGQYIGSTIKLKGGANMSAQETGSLITYARRYAYSAILGIVTDEDEDGNLASGNTAQKSTDNKATDKQMGLLRNLFRNNKNEELKTKITEEIKKGITSGRASEIIDLLKGEGN